MDMKSTMLSKAYWTEDGIYIEGDKAYGTRTRPDGEMVPVFLGPASEVIPKLKGDEPIGRERDPEKRKILREAVGVGKRGNGR